MAQRPAMVPPQSPAAASSWSSARPAGGSVRARPARRRGLPVITEARPVDRRRAIHRSFPPRSGSRYVYTACFQGYFLYVGTADDLADRFEQHRHGDRRLDRRADELTEMAVMSDALPTYQSLEAETRLIWFYLREGREVLNRRRWTIDEMRRGGDWLGVLRYSMHVYPRVVIRNPTTRYPDPCPRAWYWPIPREP